MVERSPYGAAGASAPAPSLVDRDVTSAIARAEVVTIKVECEWDRIHKGGLVLYTYVLEVQTAYRIAPYRLAIARTWRQRSPKIQRLTDAIASHVLPPSSIGAR